MRAATSGIHFYETPMGMLCLSVLPRKTMDWKSLELVASSCPQVADCEHSAVFPFSLSNYAVLRTSSYRYANSRLADDGRTNSLQTWS